MRILMFGWEFPPHISGGLGTACHGLTQALGKNKVEILFVVPTLHGGEKVDNGYIINASTVIIPSAMPAKITPLVDVAGLPSHIQAVDTKTQVMTMNEEGTEVTYLKAASSITPYGQHLQDENFAQVRQWNYTLPQKYSISRIYPESKYETDKVTSISSGVSYQFSGKYGPALLDEVDKYALVAGTISDQYDFDVIHAHDWLTFRAGIEAKKRSGKPLIVHVHATEYDRAGKNGDAFIMEVERAGMMEADLVVAVSERTKSIAVAEYQIPPAKIEVVHNGIIASEKPSNNFSIPIGSHVITFLGRITYQKGPLFFVEAARKVLEEFPDAHFVAGGSGDLFPAMVERVAQLRMSTNFHFTGFVKGEQVNKLWSISDVYVMPSVSEPFGITPLEAIQAGVPVIISNQSGVGEVMPHAIKVDFWNTDALAEAICSVLKYKSLSKTLKKNSTNEIKNISWDKAAKKIKSLYYEFATKTRLSA
ncbi:glycosyltransferase [Chryseolinea sp. H1M3-3]|uniref:glycosyltransferase n=1 Tax=Chryseolinea sp. H1M3-3 TaxID=3034144 RepID=UPI0023ED8D0C|nr:glycosyltransferase [Chryseolinea sp. H1M3-3]